MYTFSEFLYTVNMKNKTTRNIKLQQVLSNLALDTKLNLRDNDISSNSALVKLKPMERAHLVCFVGN